MFQTMTNKLKTIGTVLFAFCITMGVLAGAPATLAQSPREPYQEKLLNGLKILMWPDAKADKVTLTVRVHSGAAFDPQGREGLMQMLSDNIFPSEAARDFFAEDLGGGLEVKINYDYIEIKAWSKPEGFLTMLETVSAAVSNPAIDKETTARLRTALLTSLKTLEADPAYVADRAVARRLLGTFPYGRPIQGTQDSLQKIEFADLLDAKKRFLTADNATIAISGNFDRSLGMRALRRYFGAWLKSDKTVPPTFRQPDAPPVGLQTIPSPRADRSAIRFGFRGVARNDKDFASAEVFAMILETRLKARVPAAYAASVFVRNEEHVLPGLIAIGFSADKGSVGQGNGKIEANDLIMKALADPITESEFTAAKTMFAGVRSHSDPVTIWIDAQTFGIADVNAQSRIAEKLSVSDVRTFAENIARSPVVSVLVNSLSVN